MANISKIKIGSTTYDIKDAGGRNLIIWRQPAKLCSQTSNDTWYVGTTKTINNAPNYMLFGAITQNAGGTVDSDKMHIGTWAYPNTRTGAVTLTTSFDTGSRSYFMVIYFTTSSNGTSWTLQGASGHELLSSGNGHVTNHIYELWGLL